MRHSIRLCPNAGFWLGKSLFCDKQLADTNRAKMASPKMEPPASEDAQTPQMTETSMEIETETPMEPPMTEESLESTENPLLQEEVLQTQNGDMPTQEDVMQAQEDVMQTQEGIPMASVAMHIETETMTMAAAVSMAEESIRAQMDADAAAMAQAGLVMPVEAEEKPNTRKETRKNLTDQERLSIVQYLLANSAGGRLKHGDMKAAAAHFGVHRATIRRLWKLHLATSNAEGLAGNVASRIKGRSGRKPKVPDEEMKERIAAIPPERRMTGRGLSAALGVSNSVVVRLVKEGKLRRHPKKLHYVM